MIIWGEVSRNALLAAIRKQGLIRIADVDFAVLELDGTISVIKVDDHRPHVCLLFEIAEAESAKSAEASRHRRDDDSSKSK